MEKKQLFNSSLIGFHPEIFDSYLQISVDIGDNNYESNFTINQTITVDDDFINNYNNTPDYSVGVLAINMTYNGDQTVRHLMSFVKGNEGSYANHIRNGFTYNISINNINTVDKTIDLILISKIDESISLDNYLAKDNTTEYTPTNDYNPATKKYVDDKDNVAKLRLYNGLISLQHTAGKSLINDTCESFADFIAIFDNLQQLDGTKFTNPFTSMTLPTNVNEFLEAFQSFLSTYNVYDAGHLVYPMMGAHASDENIIIIGFYRHIIGPAEIQFGNKNYLNWQANSIFGFGINVTNGNYVQVDDYQNSTLSLDTTLVTDLIERVNNLDLSDYIKKNNTTVYTPTGDYNPATKKYVDDSIPELATTSTSGLMSKEDKAKLDGKNSAKDINLDSIINKIKAEPEGTDVDITSEFNSLFGSWSEFKSNVRNYNYINQSYTLNGGNDRYTWSSIFSNYTEGSEAYDLYKYMIWLNGDSIIGRLNILHLSKTSGENNALYGDGNYKRTLSCTNTDEYTPTANYHPATKKYVDDNISLNNKNVFVVNDGYNLLDIDSYSEWTETISIPKKLSSDNTLFIINIRNITNNDDLNNSIIISIRTKPTSSTVGYSNNISDAIGNKYNIYIWIKYENSSSNDNYYSVTFTCEQFKYTQRILTESEYAALGTAPNTDNVLYFITPD